MPNTLDSLPATFEQRTAAKAGVSSTALHRHLKAGRIERIGRGLYRQADATPADLDLLASRSDSRRWTDGPPGMDLATGSCASCSCRGPAGIPRRRSASTIDRSA